MQPYPYGTYEKFQYQTVNFSGFKNGLASVFKAMLYLTAFFLGVTILVSVLYVSAPFIQFIVPGALVAVLVWEHLKLRKQG